MALKRLVQAAMAAVVVAAGAMPASAQQVLKVGSTPTGVPFTFLDTKTNSIQGIMVDLITEVGKDAGFAVQIEPMQFSALVPSLTSNKIDIISAAMFATAARKEVIDFSDAVYTYGHPTVDAAMLDRLPAVRVISNFGVGVDHIDVRAATARGIPVGNTPGILDGATADLAFALILAAGRRVAEGDRYARGPARAVQNEYSPKRDRRALGRPPRLGVITDLITGPRTTLQDGLAKAPVSRRPLACRRRMASL